MAVPSGSCIDWDDAAGDEEWEICNDFGFVYKRRRLPTDGGDSHQSPPPRDREDDIPRARAQKKKALIYIRDKYRKELDLWEQLSAPMAQISAAAGPTEAPANAQHPSPAAAAASVGTPSLAEIDELLLQAEGQESMIAKLSELCDYVDAVVEAEEERMAKTLMELPVWGSPRSLIASLTSPPSPSAAP